MSAERGRLLPRLAAIGLAGIWLSGPAAAQIRVRADLEPRVLSPGQTATLTVETRADGLGDVQFQPTFTLENFERSGGVAESNGFSIENGRISRACTFVWHLRPLHPGTAAVRSLALRLHGRTLPLADQEIRVEDRRGGMGAAPFGIPYGAPPESSPPGAGPPDRAPNAEDLIERMERFFEGNQEPEPRNQVPEVFLRSEVEPANPVVGQQVVYTLYLYRRAEIAAVNPTTLPSFQGFWVRNIPAPPQRTAEFVTVGGVTYDRIPVLRKALFPLRAGRHTLEPATAEVLIERSLRDLLGSAVSRPDEENLEAPSIAIEVRPLPPAPAGFSGLVGQLSLSTSLQPGQVRPGDSATFAVTLAGAGNLQGIPAPELSPPPGVTVTKAQQQSDDRLAGNSVQGTRTWTYIAVPGRPGRYTLQVPPVLYFDPAHGEYRLARAAPLALVSAGPPALAQSPTLHGIRSAALFDHGTGDLAPRRLPALLPWLFALPLGVLLAFVLGTSRRLPWIHRLSRRSGAAAAPARDPQAESLEGRLRECEAEARPRRAAALLEASWRDFLAARWGLPAATPPSRWGDLLEAGGGSSEDAVELRCIAQDLDYLRHAPQLSATGDILRDVIARSRRFLRRLR